MCSIETAIINNVVKFMEELGTIFIESTQR